MEAADPRQRPQEGLREQVLGRCVVSGAPAKVAEDRRGVGAVQRAKRVRVSRLGAADQLFFGGGAKQLRRRAWILWHFAGL